MMAELHVICRNWQYLERIEDITYESGYWPLTAEEAERLISGMLYLHETKAERSYFGGIVERFRKADLHSPHPGRMIFTLRASGDGRGKRWRGKNDAMVWVGGVIDDEMSN